jgi:branched-chain amino acid transport system substrate-binding protein
MITASATAAAVTCQMNDDGTVAAVYENMFRSCFIDPFQGNKMAAFAKEQLNASTAAVLYNVGSDYSAGCAKSFQETAQAQGLEVLTVESYADGAVDFQSQLTNIAAKNPDVLFIPDYYSVVALVAQQAYAAGVKSTMLGSDGWDSVLDVVTDPALLEGSYYCSGYSIEDTREAVQTFVANYQAKYGATPNMFAAQGYDAAMIMAAAVEKAEASGAKAGSDAYTEAIIAAMKATDMDCVTGHVTYNEYNNPEKSAAIITFENGAAKFWGNY